jgi:hypothetical protein
MHSPAKGGHQFLSDRSSVLIREIGGFISGIEDEGSADLIDGLP